MYLHIKKWTSWVKAFKVAALQTGTQTDGDTWDRNGKAFPHRFVGDNRGAGVFLCMVLLTGMHQTTSPIWHQLRQSGHIFALPTASSSTSLGHGRGWTIMHSWSLVRAPGTHFLLTSVVHPVWTLLRSVSNHICFLLLTSYNNFLNLSNCLLLCIICTAMATSA